MGVWQEGRAGEIVVVAAVVVVATGVGPGGAAFSRGLVWRVTRGRRGRNVDGPRERPVDSPPTSTHGARLGRAWPCHVPRCVT